MANENEVIIEVGATVKFLGYEEDTPEQDRVLEQDAEYEVIEIDESGDEPILIVKAPNPAYDSKKRASKNNPETIEVEVFSDEVEVVGGAEETPAVEEKPARTRAKPAAKEAAPAKAEAKPAAKGSGKTKPAAKSGTKPAAKAKAKAEPAEKVDPLDVDLENEDEEIKELCAVGDEDLLQLADEAVEDASAIEYKLGGILYHVRKTKAYQGLDERYTQKANPAAGQLSGFQLYTQERLGVDYRKAMNLIEIYVNFNLVGIAGDRVAEIGWTKASKIATVLKNKVKAGETLDDVAKAGEELVDAAAEQTVTELSETIKESYTSVGGAKGERKKMVTFKFRLFEDQAEGVRNILESTAAALGMKKLDEVFEHIVREWSIEHPVEKKATAEEKKASTRTATRAAAKPARATARA